MTCEEIQSAINVAFDSVAFPSSLSLRQGRLEDDWVLDPKKHELARSQDHQGHWSRIPDNDIFEYGDAFTFLRPDGVSYYLPAFMSYCLRRVDRLDHAFSVLMFHLEASGGDKPDGRFSLLTDPQRSAVQAFLEWFADYASDRSTRDAARRALHAYWNKFKDWSA